MLYKFMVAVTVGIMIAAASSNSAGDDFDAILAQTREKMSRIPAEHRKDQKLLLGVASNGKFVFIEWDRGILILADQHMVIEKFRSYHQVDDREVDYGTFLEDRFNKQLDFFKSKIDLRDDQFEKLKVVISMEARRLARERALAESELEDALNRDTISHAEITDRLRVQPVVFTSDLFDKDTLLSKVVRQVLSMNQILKMKDALALSAR